MSATTYICTECDAPRSEDKYTYTRCGRRLRVCNSCRDHLREHCAHALASKKPCRHTQRRRRCVDCGGVDICEHLIRKNRCHVCEPVRAESARIQLVTSAAPLLKENLYIAELGCDRDTLRAHLSRYFSGNMSFSNYMRSWVADHRIPLLYRANKDDVVTMEDIATRAHYTNLQPLHKYLNNVKCNNRRPDLDAVLNDA